MGVRLCDLRTLCLKSTTPGHELHVNDDGYEGNHGVLTWSRTPQRQFLLVLMHSDHLELLRNGYVFASSKTGNGNLFQRVASHWDNLLFVVMIPDRMDHSGIKCVSDFLHTCTTYITYICDIFTC